MPGSKKGRNKDAEKKSQTSLFSFVDEDKVEKESKKKPKIEGIKAVREESPIEPPKKILEQRTRETVPKEKPKTNVISQISFFKEKHEPFGLKEGNIKIEKVLREGVTSKYIRYLIAKGEIVENLERGLLLDVDYDGGQNKAFCKFYDLDTEDIKIWIDTTKHEPYCLSKEPISELEKLTFSDKTKQINK